MSGIPPPQTPQFRVTLFFGPETDEADAGVLYCVFNVKKRSWKGGVQVVVKLEQSQFKRLKAKLGFIEWLRSRLSHVPAQEQREFIQRGHDILAQCLCQTKLLLAIKEGLQQENCELNREYLTAELEEEVERGEELLKTQVLNELDLPLPE